MESGFAWVVRQTDKILEFGQSATHSPTKKAIAIQEIRSCVGLELLMANFFPFSGSKKEDGSTVTVNRESYKTLMRDVLWPSVWSEMETEGYFYMLDGAPPHCTNVALEFLEETFPNRVIGRRSNRSWPARSPDLNPVDFFVWGYLEGKLVERKPVTVENVKRIVEEEATKVTVIGSWTSK